MMYCYILDFYLIPETHSDDGVLYENVAPSTKKSKPDIAKKPRFTSDKSRVSKFVETKFHLFAYMYMYVDYRYVETNPINIFLN